MKIAIVHDWLVTIGGAERVLEQMICCFPDADIYSIVDFLSDNDRSRISNKTVSTSFIQKLPGAKKYYRQYLPFMPIAVEQFDLSTYDIIISSSHAVAKGIITGPDQLHICLCYSPIRYAWDLSNEYLERSNLTKGIRSILARILMHYIRIWDVRSSFGVDEFISISHFISRRVEKSYRRSSKVIYPSINVSDFDFAANKKDYFVTASRLVPYKGVDIIINAFKNLPSEKLVVIGDGPDLEKCKLLAGDNVKILGYQSQEELKEIVKYAKAFIFASEEDFGIAPIEAQACGTPVIALGRGAALETIRGLENSHPTGLFFKDKSPISVSDAINYFNQEFYRINPSDCRENALRFSHQRFRSEFTEYEMSSYDKFQTKYALGRK